MKPRHLLLPLSALCTASLAGPVGAEPGDPAELSSDAFRLKAPLEWADDDAPAGSLREALSQGKSWVKLNYRYENADDDAVTRPEEAQAHTLRTVLGYETGVYEGFSGLLEFEDVSAIFSENYDSTVNGMTDHAVVADPDGGEVNQSYVQYAGGEDATVRLGRQRITLAKHRFIGNVVWRQNEQTYDALSVTCKSVADFELFYAYVANVNRVFGDDSPMGDRSMNSHLLHATREFEGVGMLNAYAYHLDYEETAMDDTLSTTTVGASLEGRSNLGEDLDLLWSAELAGQEDAGDNPNNVHAAYYRAEVGPACPKGKITLTYEVLEGSGDSGEGFQTSLATLHGFNGWADKFLTTPDDGLEDFHLSIGGEVAGTNLLAVWHEFSSDSGSRDYGTELDLRATRKLADDVTVGLKYADFESDDAAFSDTQKFWLWLSYSF